jgi:hypothetical protein
VISDFLVYCIVHICSVYVHNTICNQVEDSILSSLLIILKASEEYGNLGVALFDMYSLALSKLASKDRSPTYPR